MGEFPQIKFARPFDEVLLPYPQLSRVFGLTPMALEFLPVLAGILLVYIVTAEGAKKIFYQRVRF